jgi:hypothetical protein
MGRGIDGEDILCVSGRKKRRGEESESVRIGLELSCGVGEVADSSYVG